MWRPLAHSALDWPIAFVIFVPTLVLTILTLATAVTLVLSILAFTGLFVWTHWMAKMERSRLAALLGVRLADPTQPISARVGITSL